MHSHQTRFFLFPHQEFFYLHDPRFLLGRCKLCDHYNRSFRPNPQNPALFGFGWSTTVSYRAANAVDHQRIFFELKLLQQDRVETVHKSFLLDASHRLETIPTKNHQHQQIGVKLLAIIGFTPYYWLLLTIIGY